jgi:hypothetical protein
MRLLKAIVEAIQAVDDDAKWLRDKRLRDVRQRLYHWLSRIPPEYQKDAATCVVGALSLPSWLIPECGVADAERSASRQIREKHKEATDVDSGE